MILIEKDIIISQWRQETELNILLGIFIFSNLLNLFAIIWFGSPWYEIFTSIFYVAAFTLVIYALSVVVRIIWFCIKYRKENKDKRYPNESFYTDNYINL